MARRIVTDREARRRPDPVPEPTPRRVEPGDTYLTQQGPRPVANGLPCPKCGKPLRDSRPGIVLTSNPPQIEVQCTRCDYTGTRPA